MKIWFNGAALGSPHDGASLGAIGEVISREEREGAKFREGDHFGPKGQLFAAPPAPRCVLEFGALRAGWHCTLRAPSPLRPFALFA